MVHQNKNLYYRMLIAGVFLFVSVQFSFADIIILKNGRRITGNIIGESETTITVKSVLGSSTINRNLISEILKEDQEVNHIRNGDYYMEKGEYAAATTEYSAALRLNPNLVEIEQKLNEANVKLAQSTIDRLAPAFADGDRLLSKGFYDDAVREYRLVAKSHPELEYQNEYNRKIEELCRALLTKGDENVVTRNYNNALAMYQKVTTFNSGELANQSADKIKKLAIVVFGEADAYVMANDLVNASQAYHQVEASNPGTDMESFIKERMKQLAVQLRYKPKSGDQWKYRMTQKSTMQIPVSGQNNSRGNIAANMEFDISALLNNKIDKVEGDEFDIIMTLENMKANAIFANMKQNIPIPNFQQKSFNYRISNTGKSIRMPDLSSITGEEVAGTESMYGGIGSGYFSTLPLDTVHVGEKWVEPINQQITIGSIGKMSLNGRINYTLLGFENKFVTKQKYACAKIEGKFEDVIMSFSGNIKPSPDQPAQSMNMMVTMDGTSQIYFAYNEGKLVATSNNLNLAIDMGLFSGGGTTPTQITPSPDMNRAGKGGRELPPEMMGPEGGRSMPSPGTPSPMLQTGQMNITGTVESDIVLIE